MPVFTFTDQDYSYTLLFLIKLPFLYKKRTFSLRKVNDAVLKYFSFHIPIKVKCNTEACNSSEEIAMKSPLRSRNRLGITRENKVT